MRITRGGMRFWRGVVWLAAVAVLAVACSSAAPPPVDPGEPIGAPVPPSLLPPPRPTPPPDPFAIPDVIDADYVERVYRALRNVQTDALRDLVARRDELVGGPLPIGFLLRYRAVNDDGFYTALTEKWRELLVNGEPFGLRDPLGEVGVVVRDVVDADRDCILFRADVDISETAAIPPPGPDFQEITLHPKIADNDPLDLNPTPWYVENERPVDRVDDTGWDTTCRD